MGARRLASTVEKYNRFILCSSSCTSFYRPCEVAQNVSLQEWTPGMTAKERCKVAEMIKQKTDSPTTSLTTCQRHAKLTFLMENDETPKNYIPKEKSGSSDC